MNSLAECPELALIYYQVSASLLLKRMFLLRLRLTQKALQLPFQFFFFFSLSSLFLDGPPKSFLVNVFWQVINKACDRDLTHSLDTLKCLSVNVVPQVVIRDACSTWYSLCTVTTIQSIQKSIRNSPLETRKQVSQWVAEDTALSFLFSFSSVFLGGLPDVL